MTEQGTSKNRYHNIIFDLDGTLTDSADGVINSVHYALQKIGINADSADLKSFIGPPLQRSFREKYGFNEEKVQEAISYFREYYREKGIYENRLYPGVGELLEKLAGKGKKIYLATSKATPFAETVLRYFQIDHYFEAVSGATLDGSRVEKKDVLAHLVELSGNLYPQESVMVGDRKHDVIGARDHGLDTVAVTYGYGSVEELSGEKPTYLVYSVKELTDLLLNQ